jgi:REP element-mobilizing transposase RayT
MARRCPSLLLVHVVWTTLGRVTSIPQGLDEKLLAMCGSKARELDCVLLAAGCTADHVHVLLRLAPTAALADVVQRLKGATAHDINQRGLVCDKLRWQPGYWAESLGPSDVEPLARYVRNQRRHHDDSHVAESWQRGADW